MKKISIIITSTLFAILLCFNPKQADAASIYYTFTGPITNVVVLPEFSPPWEWFFSDPTYFTSRAYGFIKPLNYGSITHIIEVDMQKEGTWTDNEGVTNYFPPREYPMYYANYIFGSLTKNSYIDDYVAKNNYLSYNDTNLDIYVSYNEKFITLYNWEYEAAPDPGLGFNLNHAFRIRDGDWFLLTKISNTNPIPEPTTIFLLVFGLIGAIFLKKKLQ